MVGLSLFPIFRVNLESKAAENESWTNVERDKLHSFTSLVIVADLAYDTALKSCNTLFQNEGKTSQVWAVFKTQNILSSIAFLMY